MKMDEATIKAYPKLHYYVRVNMPEAGNVAAIVSQIKKLAGTTSRATIKNALKWGHGPTIEVVPNLVCAGVNAYGCYSWGGDILQIDEAMVKDFEAGKGVVKNAKGKRVYLVGATLLHELTHWADAQDGVDNPVAGDPGNEEGNAYEKGVYGKVLP
jgi:zincin-like metallopeptidase toxin 3 of polymorphic toxin system